MSPINRVPTIQLVSRIFAPEPAAASFRLESLVKALAGRGAKVRVLSTIPAPGTNRLACSTAENLPSVNVRRVQAKRDKTGYIRGYLPYLSFDIPAFFRLLKVSRPDVYVVEPPPTTGVMVRVLSWLQHRPYVYYAADVWSDAAAVTSTPKPIVWVLRIMERFALSGAKEVIAVSPGVASRCKQLGAKQTALVYNGIDTKIFSPNGSLPQPVPGFDWHPQKRKNTVCTDAAVPDSSKESAMVNPNVHDIAPLFVYAGTASEWQGAEIFIQAFQQVHHDHSNARLLFLGQGSAWNRIAKLAKRFPPGVVGLAQVGQGEAAAWQRAATAVLVSIRPGLGYDFAYPTKVLSGLSCGTPVIYAGSGPARQDLQEKELGLVLDYDTEQVAEAMSQFISGNFNQYNQLKNTAKHPFQAEYLHSWVLSNRSLSATGSKAGEVVWRVYTKFVDSSVSTTRSAAYPSP